MKNPVHPGFIIKHDCLEPLDLSITAGAEVLGVTRASLSKVVNARGAVSTEMAIRLEKAGWSTAESWLRMQMAHDLAQAKKNADKIKVKPYRPAKEPVLV